MKQFVFLLILIVLLGGGYWWWQNGGSTQFMEDDNDSAMENDMDSDDMTASVDGTMEDGMMTGDMTQTLGSYTMVEVSAHKDATSCWSVIDGKVYDLTGWVSQHPGGEKAILGLCGKDGTAAFHGQHDDNKKQADILATMKIGVLAQ